MACACTHTLALHMMVCRKQGTAENRFFYGNLVWFHEIQTRTRRTQCINSPRDGRSHANAAPIHCLQAQSFPDFFATPPCPLQIAANYRVSIDAQCIRQLSERIVPKEDVNS